MKSCDKNLVNEKRFYKLSIRDMENFHHTRASMKFN